MTTATEAPANFSTTDYAERVSEMHKALHDQIAQIASSEEWQAWLELGSKFWQYSFNNLILMWIQHPGFTHVGGEKNCWNKKFNRTLKEGEFYRPIWILAPRLVNPSKSELANGLYREGQKKCIGFKSVRVFDVSQTEGDPLPEQPAQVQHVGGKAPVGLYTAMVSMIKAEGFSFELGDMPLGHEEANGVTMFDTMKVVVKRGMSQAQTVKTTAHELAHVLLHRPDDAETRTVCRADAEVEAESVAFIVLGAHGVKTDGYSFGYIVGWAGREGAARVVKTGERVMRCAKKILQNAQPEEAAI